MTHVKLCGFQTPESALAAVDAGADAVGLVFVPGARRRVTAVQAEAIVATLRSAGMREIVGMFADQPVEEVNMLVERLGLDAVQLCGSEGMGYCAQMRVPVYKVITIDPTIPASAQMPRLMVLLQRHTMAGHRPVLDARVDGQYGGTGQRIDWELAAGLAEAFELTLAGGLTPDNVAEAVRTVRPWGVDSSSGVETDGQKDPQKVVAFVREVRRVDSELRSTGLRGLLGRLAGRR